jgi:hypothetical protein
MGVRGQRHAQPLFTPGKDPVPIVQKAGCAPFPVWTGAENLAPTGIRSPDRPARSQSLYRLSYPTHTINAYIRIVGHLTVITSLAPSQYSNVVQLESHCEGDGQRVATDWLRQQTSCL